MRVGVLASVLLNRKGKQNGDTIVAEKGEEEPKRRSERDREESRTKKGESGSDLKAPVKRGDNPRRASFLARMGNAKGPEYKDGKPTRLLLSLKAWGASSKEDARAKARAIGKRNESSKNLSG